MGCLLKQGGGLYPRLRIGAVLLAAGGGRRMGGVAKPLIRLQGVPLINRQLIALSGASVDEVVVVTGHARAAVEKQMESFSVMLAHNEEYTQGQESSVRVGLAALNGPFDAIFIVPSDQPLIAAGDLIELIGAFKKRPTGHIVVPVVEGRRGNPIVIDEIAHAQILASGAGCRQLMERQPEMMYAHETANTRFISDLDTVEDVRTLMQRTGWRLELPSLEAAA